MILLRARGETKDFTESPIEIPVSKVYDMPMKICAHCRKTLDAKLEIMRSTACPFCRADLRSCINCEFYSPGAHWDCRETISEAVRDKEKANFCDFFRFKDTASTKQNGKAQDRSKEDFFNLFDS